VADAGPGQIWPRWARRLVTVALGLHLAAMVAAALAQPPSSPLERAVADLFAGYYQLIDQGYSYRYYSPEPPPTPVVEAELRFADGRAPMTVRLPDRQARPRMLYQRQLALANHLYVEFLQLRDVPPDLPPEARPVPRWAASYARHLGHVHGCDEAVLSVSMHLVPPVGLVHQRRRQGQAIDLDAEEFYQVRERIGVFPCDGS
jgi:hypothetical protein